MFHSCRCSTQAICFARRLSTSRAGNKIAPVRALSESEIAAFHTDGFVIVRGMFAPDEAALLLEAARSDELLAKQAFHQNDAAGNASKLLVWNHAVGDNIFCDVARGRRLVRAAETLLGGEVYHWHSKLALTP